MRSWRRCSTSEPRELRAGGLNVERNADHFQHDTPDEIWLSEIGRKGWIAVTHDGRIRYKPNELATVMANGVALLVVVGHAPYPELAQSFVATAPRIMSFVAQHRPPYIAKVYRPSPADAAKDPSSPGRIELWHPKAATVSRRT